jgi:zinc protease
MQTLTRNLDGALDIYADVVMNPAFPEKEIESLRGRQLVGLRQQKANPNAVSNVVYNKVLYGDHAYGRDNTEQSIKAITRDDIVKFYESTYRPNNGVLIVVGDFDPELVEQQIVEKFASWKATPAAPQPSAGPVNMKDDPRTDVYLDPALAERVVASRHGRFLAEPDSVAQRQENLLRQIGYAIINRRLQRVSRQTDPPFRGAGVGTGDVFKAGRTTRLIVDTPYRRADIDAGMTRGMNVTRLQVPGWPDHRAVRVDVDPARPDMFGFRLVMAPEEAAGARP